METSSLAVQINSQLGTTPLSNLVFQYAESVEVAVARFLRLHASPDEVKSDYTLEYGDDDDDEELARKTTEASERYKALILLEYSRWWDPKRWADANVKEARHLLDARTTELQGVALTALQELKTKGRISYFSVDEYDRTHMGQSAEHVIYVNFTSLNFTTSQEKWTIKADDSMAYTKTWDGLYVATGHQRILKCTANRFQGCSIMSTIRPLGSIWCDFHGLGAALREYFRWKDSADFSTLHKMSDFITSWNDPNPDRRSALREEGCDNGNDSDDDDEQKKDEQWTVEY